MKRSILCMIALFSLLLLAGCKTDTSLTTTLPSEEPSPAVSDFPVDQERLSLLAENDSIWVQLSTDSTLNGSNGNVRMLGNIFLTIYTQEGKYVQTISYGAYLDANTHLIDFPQNPTRFISLSDTNNDGYDDLTVLTDEQEQLYHTFLWDETIQQFNTQNI